MSRSSIRIAGAWEALLVYDCIIFGLTIFKTWSARHHHVITGISIPLTTLLLRDGAIYFAVLVFCNLLNILTFYVRIVLLFPGISLTPLAFTGPFLRGELAAFATCMSIVMICRLMLNLHRIVDSGIHTTHRTLTEFYFASVSRTEPLDSVYLTTGTLDIETSSQDPWAKTF
ncbi:hypothetical protein D9619_010635 [Psilocybe cf. subviscida]|uniref:Uncharacterized protein n=1 Tax=Psilocybe cf. subviscida TaxID=2480587 RepID=A0A8H5B8F6_9AGAR|nr:hypothetical protein D9619_010635 [Psilocybe cf. subviscida]